MKLLLVGPRVNKKDPLLTGGAVILFEDLIRQLDQDNIHFTLVDTNKANYPNKLLAYLSIMFQIIIKQKGHDHISLHTSRDYNLLGVLIVLLGKVLNKRTSLRKFGGEIRTVYMESGRIRKRLIDYIFSNMDVLFFEIKHIVTFFSGINEKCFWFPNVRSRGVEPVLPRTFRKKYIFISSVKHEKGIDEIVEACQELDNSYTLDIYGPIEGEKYSVGYFEEQNVSYKGAVNAADVLAVLDQYDVILLPTYYPGEGYPGVLIEAYSLGMPCITTSLHGIKEIVDDRQTGILIEPQNVTELTEAIKYFDDNNYHDMSKKAYKKFDLFESSAQTKIFLKNLTV